MKRALIIIIGLSAVQLGGRLPAQQGGPSQPPPAAAPAVTKVGVINVAHLYLKWNYMKTMKDHMEKKIEPYKAQKEKLEKYISGWKAALSNPNAKLKAEEIEQGNQTIKEGTRQLQDLQLNFNRDVGKRFEEDMEKAIKHVNDMVKHFAVERGFHLVAAYGEPDQPLAPELGFQRTMRAIDRGFTTLPYLPNAIDVTQDVLTLLNR